MNKKEEKTLLRIYTSFTNILKTIPYEEVTVQDILDSSSVSRSTFYSHFKTKDDLMINLTKSMFNHVFSHSLEEEKSHDFSKAYLYDYKHLITHIFYHMRDDKDLIKGILNSSANNIFQNELRVHLDSMADIFLSNYISKSEIIPQDLKKQIMVEDFLVILSFWIKGDCKQTPETLTEYLIESIK